MGGVSACGVPGTTWERVPGARSSGVYRPGRHPRDGRRLRVRGTRHACGHAGAVPYSGRRAPLSARPSRAQDDIVRLGTRPSGAQDDVARPIGAPAARVERAPPGCEARVARRGRTWERVPGGVYRPGRHPRDGRRLHVRGPRHDRGHAGAVPYSGRRARLGARTGRGGILATGGISTCRVPGTTAGTPEPCPTADGERAWERAPGAPLGTRPSGAQGNVARLGARSSGVYRPGRHPRDGRRLHVRGTRHDREHAGAVSYSGRRARLGARTGWGGILAMGGVSACGAPGTPAGTPEPCPTAGGEHAWERYRPGRHPRDGRRLHVRGTRHDREHAGAVSYSGRRARLGARTGWGGILATGGVSACGAPGTPAGTPEPCPTADGERAWERVQAGEASSRRVASPRAGHPARLRARRSRALQRAVGVELVPPGRGQAAQDGSFSPDINGGRHRAWHLLTSCVQAS